MNDLELINPNISENGISKFIFLRPITLQQNQPDKPNIFELTYSMNMIEKEEQQCKNRKLAFNFKELQGSNNFKHKFVFKSLIKNIQEDDEKAQVLATLIYKSGEEKIQHNMGRFTQIGLPNSLPCFVGRPVAQTTDALPNAEELDELYEVRLSRVMPHCKWTKNDPQNPNVKSGESESGFIIG